MHILVSGRRKWSSTFLSICGNAHGDGDVASEIPKSDAHPYYAGQLHQSTSKVASISTQIWFGSDTNPMAERV